MKNYQLKAFSAALTALLLIGCPPPPAEEPGTPEAGGLPQGAPRLILFLVVDQARADYPERFRPLLRHGLARLLEESVVFTDAHHDHASTATSPGHATLSTGRHPSAHGIVSNYWYDRSERDEAYSVRDSDGVRTPERLETSTIGDWLKAVSPSSKVFTASGKDRSAILTAGKRADAAYWYDQGDGDFVTAPHYGRSRPPWLDAFHTEHHAARFFGRAWEALPEALDPQGLYGVEPLDEGLFRSDLPHPLGLATLVPGEDFYKALYRSPFLDQYLTDFVLALIEGEDLGGDEATDFLGVSFPALDAVGHRYGPDSPELLDTLLRLDVAVGRLLDAVEAKVGLDQVVVSLSSDHGVTPVPELLRRQGAKAGRLGAEEITCVQGAYRKLRDEFGAEDWLLFDLYFDHALAESKGVALRDLEEAVRRYVEPCPGIARVWGRSELEALAGGELEDPFARLYVHNLHPKNSPDVFLQLEAHTLESSSSVANHGSPYRYDTWVPWLLRLPEGRALTVDSRVHTVDVAPTLAALIGLATPADLDGVDRGALFR